MRRRVLSTNPERIALAAVETDEKGAFSIATAGAPAVDLVFEAEGRSIAVVEAIDGESLDPVVLREASPSRGKITAGGKPVAGALLVYPGALIARTDSNGDYVVPGQSRPAGLRVIHPSYAQAWANPSRATQSQPNARLTPGSQLRGRVVAADGKPVANASVSLDGWPLATSGDDGAFTIEHAWPQWQTLVAEEGSRAGWLSSTAKAEALMITLRTGSTIFGVVRDEGGRPLAGVSVGATMQGGAFFRPGMTDVKGRYTIERVLPGVYNIGAGRAGYHARPSEARVAEGVRVERNVTLTALPRVSGIVIGEDKRPIGGVEIDPLFFEFTTVTSADGRFRTRVPSGDQGQRFVHARKNGYALTRYPVPATGKDATIVLQRGITSEISLVDQKRAPVAGEPVALTLLGNEEMERVVICAEQRGECRTDAKGILTLQLAEGSYDLVVGGSAAVVRRLSAERIAPDRKRLVVDVQRAVTVSGRVVNSDGSPARPPMMITVRRGDHEEVPWDAAMRAVMADDGTFTLTGVPAGPLPLAAAALGGGSPTFGPTAEINAPASDVELVGPRLLRVAGQVIDRSTSQPVRDFSVSLRRLRGMGSSSGNHQPFHTEDGQFVLDRIPFGAAFELFVTAPGYAPATVGNLNLETPDAQPVTVKMDPGATLRVRVSSAGKGVEGARVTVQGDAGEMFRRPSMSTTGEDGVLVIESLSTGNYALLVSKKGYVVGRKSVELPEAKEASVDVELEAGKELRGVVVDESGRPIVQARVEPEARRLSGGPPASVAFSDAEGAFVMEGLDDSALKITASKNGFITAVSDSVQPGAGARVTLTLKRGGTITGRVTGIGADEMRMVRVMVAGGGSGRTETRPDTNGNFTLSGVQDGRVNLHAMIVSSSSSSTAQQTVEVVNGSAPPVELDFKAGVPVRGRVTRAGKPVGDVAVSFTPKTNRGAWRGDGRGITKSDGTYEVNVPAAGEYTVSVMSHGGAYHAGSTTVASSTTFDIDMRGGSVRGRVVDARTKAPVSGALVALVRKEARIGTPGITTDSDGQFHFDTVAAGAYDLRVSRQGYVSAVQPVAVAETPSADIEIALEHGEKLAIRVVDDATGKPFDRVSVSVRDMENRVVYSGAPMVDEKGVMTVALNPGRYKVTTMMGMYPSQTVEASVPGPEVLVRMSQGGKVAVAGAVGGAVSMRLVSTTNTDRYGQPPPPGRFENVGAGSYRLEVVGAKGVVIATRPVVVTSGVTTTVQLE
jgi:uncharacterized GH25 family protein